MGNFPEIIQNQPGTSIISQTRLLLATKKPHKQNDLKILLKDLGFSLEEKLGETNDKRDTRKIWRINHTNQRFWIHSSDNKLINDENIGILKEKIGADFGLDRTCISTNQ